MGVEGEVRLHRRRLWWFVALFVFGVSLAPAVYASDGGEEDPKERLKLLAKAVKQHRKAEDLRKLREDVQALETLYADCAEHDDVRAEIVDLVGSLTTVRGNEAVVIQGLHGLGDLGDPRGAKYVRRRLQQPDRRESSDVLEAAVATAGDVVHESLVAPLLQIVKKSKTYGVAADAIQSLGRYGTCEKKRVKILRDVVESVRKDLAGSISGGGGRGARGGNGGTSTDPEQGGLPAARGGGASSRWTALASVLPGAMNQLTGQDVGSAVDWIDLVQDSRGRLSDLFRDEGGGEDR